MTRVRVFIDFWNFQLAWNDEMGKHRQCDWRLLPQRILTEVTGLLASMGVAEAPCLDETRVYASYNPSRTQDTNLKRWLDTVLDRLPGFRVIVAERKDKPSRYYCRSCQQTMTACPVCSVPMIRSREKGVDTAIVTDLLALAWEGSYDVAALVSADADMIPAVLKVQEKGLKVVNAVWPGSGFDLARNCWASCDMRSFAADLIRGE